MTQRCEASLDPKESIDIGSINVSRRRSAWSCSKNKIIVKYATTKTKF